MTYTLLWLYTGIPRMSTSPSCKETVDNLALPNAYLFVLQALLETGVESTDIDTQTKQIFQDIIKQIKNI